jgi:apolipoprotein D and lipocalin family protein
MILRFAAAAVILTAVSLTATACTGVPKNITPVQNFESERYLGKWYEVVRLDHSFERGLSHVTAEYTRLPDGRIGVLNQGWNAEKGEWKTADGKASFRGAEDVGSLKVTFQWPFSGGYHVFALDPEYQWAMISGPTREFFWILSRTPTMDQAVLDKLVAQAKAAGFNTSEFIYVQQLPPIEEK